MTSSAPYRPPHTWQSTPPEQQARGPKPDTQGNEQHYQRGYRGGNQPRAYQQAPYADNGGHDYRGQQRFQGGQRSGYRGNQNQQYHRHQHHQFQQTAPLNANSQPWFPHQQQHQPFNHHAQAQNPRPFGQQGYRQPHQHQHPRDQHYHQHQRDRRQQPPREVEHQSAPQHEKAPPSAVHSDVADVTTKVAALQVTKPAPAAPRAAGEEQRPAAEAVHEPLLEFDEGPLDPNINKQVGEDPHDEYWGAWHPEFREGKHVGYILERWEEEFDIEDYEDGDVSEINVHDPLWRKVEKTFEDGKLNEVYVHDNTGAVLIGFYEGGLELENFKIATVLWPLEEEDF